jgi:hypothetical protein
VKLRVRSRVLSHLPLYVRRQLLYRRAHGRFFRRNPKNFTEKIQWRILNDRREIFALTGDKLSMKTYVESLAVPISIPKTLWHGTDLSTVMDVDWKTEWVLKPVTGSGFSAFGDGDLRTSGIDVEDVLSWNAEKSYDVYGEWHYGQARPGYLIEERIPTRSGNSPDDYRFFVFNGRVEFVQVDTPRVEKVRRRFYDRNWRALDVRQGSAELAKESTRPARLSSMIELAERIGHEYDFIRVDLYDADGQIWFGELTPCPTGGLAPYDPYAFDRELGEHWSLPVMTSGGSLHLDS